MGAWTTITHGPHPSTDGRAEVIAVGDDEHLPPWPWGL